ncbi:NAD(P)-binding protein [Eremomyces bilateralis CBS 781.70]|uniref:NAD(P)-binding protein n=1 Tax=Eremomyces bilateralis CBS 781.70 TaxID=1392243 RepID=A0A6G1G7J9_9PEZI|nr:NAD(P)-binding protein [Eremomyces bilateralis CBS 781.70]KAF1813860.1 NAD(P)-binding protein [Eremomyces bilateralis CBS 781.70]
MSRTALVTGASGLLGREVCKAFERDGWNVVGTALTRVNPPSVIKLDILNSEEIEQVLDEVKPHTIVHCAANRFPDLCSADPSAATALNVTSSGTLAAHAFARAILLLYISTDYVFPGPPGAAPYFPDSTPDPPNTYGATKLAGERAVLAATGGAADGNAPRGVVLRVPLLYGHTESDDRSKDGVHALVDALWKSQDLIDAPADAKIKMDDYAQRHPTCTEDVGRVCVELARTYLADDAGAKKLPRVVQFSAEERMTKWAMVGMFAEILGLETGGLVAWDPTKEEAEGTSTKRPYDVKLDTGALREVGVDVRCVDFRGWWRRELHAFRH